MKKTYKEKYLELKKDKEYLQFILDSRNILYLDLKDEFDTFKLNLNKKQEKADKQSFIIFIIGLSLISCFGFLGIILSSLGLI